MRMMFRVLYFLLILSISSCQREPDIVLDDIDPPPPGAADSTLLRMYLELDTTLPSGSDTVDKMIYTYDNQKRVKTSYDASPVYFPGDFSTAEYFYTGSETLPFKCVETFIDAFNSYRDTVYLYYNNGLVSMDSTITYDITANQFFQTEVIQYTASGNNTFIQARTYDLPGHTSPTRQWSGMIFKTYQNGDIVLQEDTTTYNIQYTDRHHHEVSYDNKVNPFYKTELPYPVLDKWKIQKNNSLEEIAWDVPSSIEQHYSYSYVYRIDGYPTVVRIREELNNQTLKGLFFYNHQ